MPRLSGVYQVKAEGLGCGQWLCQVQVHRRGLAEIPQGVYVNGFMFKVQNTVASLIFPALSSLSQSRYLCVGWGALPEGMLPPPASSASEALLGPQAPVSVLPALYLLCYSHIQEQVKTGSGPGPSQIRATTCALFPHCPLELSFLVQTFCIWLETVCNSGIGHGRQLCV